MKILYLSCHEILEYDEVKLLTELGHQVFSMGAYQNSNKGGNLRGEIPNLYQNEQLKAVAMQCSKENLHPELIEWADVIISMHNPHVVGLDYQQPWIANNWPLIKGKRVIWRSIGQSVSSIEQELAVYKDQGLQIIRYSPRERKIPQYAGEDAIIRFYKDPEEYKDWNGSNKQLINFTQSLKKRGDHCGYKVFMEVSAGFNTKVYGPGNEDLGDLSGGMVSYEEQKKILRDNRVCFYFGTVPASYTLSLMEAMMTGIPVVAAGIGFSRNMYPDQETNEVEEIILNEKNGVVSNRTGVLRTYIERIMDDDKFAQELSENARKTAINLFGKETIKEQWKQFLG